jgi:hypothetical protein
MNVIVVDEKSSGALETVLEKSVGKLIKDVRDAGGSLNEIVKLTVFLKTDDTNEISALKTELAELLKKEFGQDMPAYTVLGQPSLSGSDILLEAIFLDRGSKLKVDRNTFNKQSYVVISSGKGSSRLIVSGGLSSPGGDDIVFECQRVLDLAEQLLLKEDLDFSGITDQRNYIPMPHAKSRYGNSDTKNISIFENIRNLYYDPEMFKGKSLPAFAAVGIRGGSVTVDLTALAERLPGDAASPDDDMSLTGLFTAGEIDGAGEMSVEEQAKAMIKSITEKLSLPPDAGGLTYLRVYLKNENDLPLVKNVISKNISAGNIVYLKADMHDENLRVFMEAVR